MPNRATAALADKIAANMRPKWSPTAPASLIRDGCDLATGGNFAPGELDKLSTMVQSRLGKMVIEIELLREAGEDGGDFMGYYARGHFPAHEFAEECNAYSGITSHTDWRHATSKHVRHVWYRTERMPEEPDSYQFVEVKAGTGGAWKATVIDLEGVCFKRDHEMRDEARKEGRRQGEADAVGWALQWLEKNGQADLAKAMLQTWNTEADAKRREQQEAERKARLLERAKAEDFFSLDAVSQVGTTPAGASA